LVGNATWPDPRGFLLEDACEVDFFTQNHRDGTMNTRRLF
jgi:hypothetical protein